MLDMNVEDSLRTRKYPFFVASMVYAGGSSVQYFPACCKPYNKRVLGRVSADVDTFFWL